ncbi:MAG: septum formation initiator family protein [bacterium]|nr:septum formation initiator family protein [bacterium]
MAARHISVRFGYWTVLLISLTLLGIVGVSYVKDYRRSRALDDELLALRQEVSTLQTRHVELSELIKYFDSEGYAESRARLELGLAKPGEKVIVVPSNTPIPEASPVGGAQGAAPWRSWWSYFFSRQRAAP